MEPYRGRWRAGAAAPMLMPVNGQRPLADVVINTQIVLNPEGRRTELAALGIPVLQAMPTARATRPTGPPTRRACR
jgi:hypothetical protein